MKQENTSIIAGATLFIILAGGLWWSTRETSQAFPSQFTDAQREQHKEACKTAFRSDFKEYADRPIQYASDFGFPVRDIDITQRRCDILLGRLIKGWQKDNSYVPDMSSFGSDDTKEFNFYLK